MFLHKWSIKSICGTDLREELLRPFNGLSFFWKTKKQDFIYKKRASKKSSQCFGEKIEIFLQKHLDDFFSSSRRFWRKNEIFLLNLIFIYCFCPEFNFRKQSEENQKDFKTPIWVWFWQITLHRFRKDFIRITHQQIHWCCYIADKKASFGRDC